MGESVNLSVTEHCKIISLHGFSFLTSKAQNICCTIQTKLPVKLKFMCFTLCLYTELFMSSTLYMYDSFLWPVKHMYNLYIAMAHTTVVQELHRHLKK